MAALKCLGRSDRFGDPDQWGESIGFVLRYATGDEHRFALSDDDAFELSKAIKAVFETPR